MEEIGKIIKVKDKHAFVKIRRYSACSKCKQKCKLVNTHETDEIVVEVNNSINAKNGQVVKLEMNEQPLVLASLIVYLIPLLGLFGGYFIGIWLAQRLGYQAGEEVGIIGSLLFLSISFIMIRFIDYRLGLKSNFHPQITEIVN